MSAHTRLDEQIGDLSGGRLAFDPRRHRLTCHGSDDAVHELEITEPELRGLLQRLLMTEPHPIDGEPIEIAVCLLLEHLDARI